jgi:hypothetical protein
MQKLTEMLINQQVLDRYPELELRTVESALMNCIKLQISTKVIDPVQFWEKEEQLTTAAWYESWWARLIRKLQCKYSKWSSKLVPVPLIELANAHVLSSKAVIQTIEANLVAEIHAQIIRLRQLNLEPGCVMVSRRTYREAVEDLANRNELLFNYQHVYSTTSCYCVGRVMGIPIYVFPFVADNTVIVAPKSHD